MKLPAAEDLAADRNARAPEGVRYEVAHTAEGQLLADDEPEFGGYFVRRVVDRSGARGTLPEQATPDP